MQRVVEELSAVHGGVYAAVHNTSASRKYMQVSFNCSCSDVRVQIKVHEKAGRTTVPELVAAIADELRVHREHYTGGATKRPRGTAFGAGAGLTDGMGGGGKRVATKPADDGTTATPMDEEVALDKLTATVEQMRRTVIVSDSKKREAAVRAQVAEEQLVVVKTKLTSFSRQLAAFKREKQKREASLDHVRFEHNDDFWDKDKPKDARALGRAVQSVREEIKRVCLSSTFPRPSLLKRTQVLRAVLKDEDGVDGVPEDLLPLVKRKEISSLRSMAERLKTGIAELKKRVSGGCTTADRDAYGVALALTCAEPVERRDSSGLSREFGRRLGFDADTNFYRQAQQRRKQIDEERALIVSREESKETYFREGDRVIVGRDGDQPAVIKTINGDGSFIATYPGDIENSFPSMGSDSRGARLRHATTNFQPPPRKVRKDGTPAWLKEEIVAFYDKNSLESPDKGAVMRLRVSRGHYIQRQKRHRHQTVDELWEAFRREYPQSAALIAPREGSDQRHAPSAFRAAHPFYIVYGGAFSCICQKCENVEKRRPACLKAAELIEMIMDDEEHSGVETDAQFPLEKLRSLHTVLSADSKYDMCLELLRHDEKKEKITLHDKFCIDSKCGSCGLKRLWDHGVKSYVMQVDGKTVSDDAHSAWTTELTWGGLEYVPKARVIDDGGADAAYGEAKSSTELTVVMKKGSLPEFLDNLTGVTQDHLKHRFILEAQSDASSEHSRNRRPCCLDRNVDFAENLTVPDARQVQSMYWSQTQVTLHISICDWLLPSEWNLTEGELSIGDEVTVDGEMAGEEINLSSFWGVVMGKSNGASWEIKKLDGSTDHICRTRLRLRKKRTIAFIGVSDDLSHDTYAAAHFFKREMMHIHPGARTGGGHAQAPRQPLRQRASAL